MSNNRLTTQVFPLATVLFAVCWLTGLAYILTLDDPRLRFPSYVAAATLTGVGWLGLIRSVTSAPLDGSSTDYPHRRLFYTLVVLGVIARLGALACPPAFSEDVFRYVYEGRVMWHHGWTFPFAVPPADAPHMGVDPTLLDHSWLRINHPELSTIYPPLAQLVFAVAGGVGELFGGGHLWWLKTLLVLADLATWFLLARALHVSGRPIGLSLIWGLSPLVILEVAREGHADSLSTLGLSLGILGFTAARPVIGYAGWATATLAKLNGLVVMPAALRTTRRGATVAVGLIALVALPYVFAGGNAGEGIGAYASRWRAGDGAFSVLLELSGAVLGGDWARIEGLGPAGSLTLTRHQLARGLVALVFAAWAAVILLPPTDVRGVPARAGWLLLGLLLLSPTLHPWYVTWLLPFAAAAPGFRGRGAVVLLALLAPALHHPAWLELLDGRWRDLAWVRAIIHLPVWAAVLALLATRPRTG